MQRLLSRNADYLATRRIAVWVPKRTRDGLLTGVLGDPGRVDARRNVKAHRTAGRVAMLSSELSHAGVRRLVISEENILGGLRENLLLGRLYPTVSARVERAAAALPGIDHVVLSIRSPDAWWTSVFACQMMRGFAPPDRATLDTIMRVRRSWRDVIGDVAGVLPDARLTVWIHEDMASRPEVALRELTGEMPQCRYVPRLNESPSCAALQARLLDEGWITALPQVAGHYAPFTPDERAQLRDRYDADLSWLREGADGLIDRDTYDKTSPSEGPFRDRRPRHGQH